MLFLPAVQQERKKKKSIFKNSLRVEIKELQEEFPVLIRSFFFRLDSVQMKRTKENVIIYVIVYYIYAGIFCPDFIQVVFTGKYTVCLDFCICSLMISCSIFVLTSPLKSALRYHQRVMSESASLICL